MTGEVVCLASARAAREARRTKGWDPLEEEEGPVERIMLCVCQQGAEVPQGTFPVIEVLDSGYARIVSLVCEGCGSVTEVVDGVVEERG